MIGQATVGARAKPGGEAAFLGDGREDVVGFTGAERELLPARLPAEFFDKQLGEIPILQERAGVLEVEGHTSILADAERADDFGFAGIGFFEPDAEAVFLVEGKDKFDKFFGADSSAEFAVEQVAGGFGERRIVDGVNGLVERFDVEQGVLHVRGVVLEALIDTATGAGRFAKLAAGGDVFLLDAGNGLRNERVVIGQARKRGCGRFAGGGAKNLML